MKKGIAEAIVVTVFACIASVACDKTSPTPTDAPYIVGDDGNFRSITTALNAAPAGSVIEVRRGTYAERVIIEKPGMKLRAQSAVLDGTAGSLDGRGIGMLISGVADVEISGFTVRNFERGIVLRNASNTTLRANEVHANNNKGASTVPPLVTGVDLFDGVVLFGSSNNQIVDNIVRDNGHDGLIVADGSNNNIIRGNRMLNNGAQTVPARGG